MLDIGTTNRCSCFRSQGDKTPFSVWESVHFFFHNIGIFTNAPGKQFRTFHNGNTNFLKTEIFKKRPGGFFHMLPEFYFPGKDIFKSPD